MKLMNSNLSCFFDIDIPCLTYADTLWKPDELIEKYNTLTTSWLMTYDEPMKRDANIDLRDLRLLIK